MNKLFTNLSKAIAVSLIVLCAFSMRAQVATNYGFSQVNGTYTPITGGAVFGDINSDDENFVDPTVPLGVTNFPSTGPGLPIGFNFTYNGNVYDVIAINYNGWISFGRSSLGANAVRIQNAYTPLSTTLAGTPIDLRNRVAAAAGDFGGQTGSEVRMQTVGVAPNRECVIQWSHAGSYFATGDDYNFQIRLKETSNIVEVVYGSFLQNSSNRTRHVGLGGETAADFNNRIVTATTTWLTSTAGTANSSTCVLRTAIVPPTGLTFDWQPSNCPASGGLASTAVGTTTATLNWNASPTSATYNWQVVPAGNLPGVGVVASGSTATTTAAVTGLNPATTYQFYLQGNCGAGGLSAQAASASFVTLCLPFVAPFTENFNTGAGANGTIPNCWSMSGPEVWNFNQNGTTGNPNPDYDADVAADFNVGSNGYFAWVDGSGAGNNQGITLTSPLIDISALPTPELAFQLFSNNTVTAGSTPGNNKLTVKAWNGTTFVTLGVIQGNFGQNWAEFTYALNATTLGAATTMTQIQFIVDEQGGGAFSAFYNDILIDNVRVRPEPTCPAPNGIGVSSVTDVSAVVTWNNNGVSPFTTVEYGLAGFVAGTGTRIVTATGSPVTITGLLPNTSYGVYVYKNCSPSDSSTATSRINFTTRCQPFPYLGYDFANPIPVVLVGGTFTDLQNTANGCFANTVPNGQTGNDVVYRYNSNGCSQNITVGTCGNSTLDTYIRIYDAAGTTILDFNDDGCSPQSVINNFVVAPNTTYYIVMEGYSAFNNGAMGLTVNEVAGTISATPSSTNVACFGTPTGAATVTGVGGAGGFSYLWSNGDTNATAASVLAGTYTATVTDALGCSTTQSVIVAQPSAVTVMGGATNLLCNGTSTGAANIMGMGGAGGFTYAWSNGATSAAITGVAANTYTVTATDNNGCTLSSTYTITEPAALMLMPTISNVLCNAGNTGSIMAMGMGGTGALSYVWSNGNTTDTNTNLLAGTYTVTVTDANGCSMTDSYMVTEPTGWLIISTLTNNICNGGTAGSVAMVTTGGTGVHTYAWSNGNATATNANLAAGSYTVTITDGNGCIDTQFYSVTEPTAIMQMPAITNVSCFGGNNGSATDMAMGGTGALTFVWSNGDTNGTTNGLVAGSYTVTTTDANGCTASLTISITEPTVLATAATFTNVLCNSNNDGTATVTAMGGTMPYTVVWDNSAVTTTITGLAPGSYMATVTDANGCTNTAATSITQPTTFAASMTSTTNIGCFGANSGTATVTATGGTMPYTYSWSNDATVTTNTISNVAAGNYFVFITDANGCTSTAATTITAPASGIALTQTTNNQTATPANGMVDLTIVGGSSPYTIVWDNGATTEDLAGVAAGTYCATVTDANSCTQTVCATVSFVVETGSVANFASVKVMPNPTQGAFTLDVKLGESSDVTVDIFGVTGTAIATETAKNMSQKQFKFDLTALPAGVYFARIKANNDVKVVKIILATE